MQICQWYRVCDAGALRAEPLATLMSCAVKSKKKAKDPHVFIRIPVLDLHTHALL